MARSYSSYGSGFQAKSGLSKGFEGPTITGGASTDLGAAADTVNMGNSYGSLRASATEFDKISANAISLRAQEQANLFNIYGDRDYAQLVADGQRDYAKAIGKAQVDAAGDAASSSKGRSALSALGSVTGALLAFSDETTKDNIETIEDALTTLRSLRPVTFNYKEEWSSSPERMHHGFVAQEYMKVVPDATYYDSDSEKYCIDSSDLIGLLVRAVQQLETKVTRLEAANALAGVK